LGDTSDLPFVAHAPTRAFLASLLPDGRAQLQAQPGLEQRLSALCEQAAHAHPDLERDDAGWLSHLASHLHGPAWLKELETLHAADLLLAWACAGGQPAALRKLETLLVPLATAVLRRRNYPPDTIDEVIQQVRSRLLVADNGKPKVLEYSGRGELTSWLGAVTLRTALNVKRSQPTVAEDEGALVTLIGETHPEMAYLKEKYLQDFRAALAEAAATLSPRDRVLLRQFAIDGLSAAELGALYGVHRVTAFRWLGEARRALAEAARAALGRRLKLSPEELSSIIRLVRSRLDLSLRALKE
jgi:RNA polymerase sigma-70 factor (ECF subfamily)